MTCDIQIEGKGRRPDRVWTAICRTHQHWFGRFTLRPRHLTKCKYAR